MTYYDCPVCGYDALSKPPKDYYICPSCGTEFESDDFDRSYVELRSDWIEKDMPWFDRSTLQPKNWNPYRQLIIANHGNELIEHLRFKDDVNYRYAVNKAFSEVRIARQLKVLREDQTLTQSQLAEQAEMKQSRISELEGMNYSSWSIITLERLAKALGVGFRYSFAGWDELIPEIENGLTREALTLRSFQDRTASKEEKAQAAIAQYGYAYQSKWIVSGLLNQAVTPRTAIKRQVDQIKEFKEARQGAGNQPSRDDDQKRKDQLRVAASLAEPLVKVG